LVYPTLLHRSLFKHFLLIAILLSSPSFAEEIPLILSSNTAPYREALNEFKKTNPHPIHILNMEGNLALAEDLLRPLSDTRFPVIVTFGTPALKSALEIFPDNPILFTMVHSPPEIVFTQPKITGVFLDIPLEKYLILIKKTLPKTKRVGILMNPNFFREHVEDMKLVSKYLDLTIHIQKAGTLKEALHGIMNLTKKDDVIILQPDPLFATDLIFRFALKQCLLQSIPLVGTAETQVEHGALLGLGVDYKNLGKQTADMLHQMVEGPRSANLPVVGPTKFKTFFNLKTAGILGISIPPHILNGKEKIF